MICPHAKELIAASWTGELEAEQESRLKQHLAECEECSLEMTQLGAIWERLADIPAPEPSHALAVRWEATLESLKTPRPYRQNSWKFSLAALWPQRPVWQVTIAVACLAVGTIAGGYGFREKGRDRSEIAALRDEVASTKEMVALSLLQQQSAGERLRGVDYTSRMSTMEPEVVAALIQAVNHDSNVNVRLAAIDALTRASANPQVRQSMVHSLGEQDSPMVQAALIDYLVDARDPQALGPIRQLAGRDDLNPAVRQRAATAMRQLTEYR
jgi:anti-sigma factor RsiW